MAYYLLEYDLADDYLQRRTPLRGEHLALAERAHEEGLLRTAGALADPPDRAVFVWQVDDPAPIEAFVQADPYVQQGLVRGWRVRPWTVVIGG